MKSSLLFFTILVLRTPALSQFRADETDKIYYTECTDWRTYRGKAHQGQRYCVSWSTFRILKTGAREWRGGVGPIKMFNADTYDAYNALSPRLQNIVDSLWEDGIPEYSNTYIRNAPAFMQESQKRESFYEIQGQSIVVFEYEFKIKQGSRMISMLVITK